jgi:hypothetical protein
MESYAFLVAQRDYLNKCEVVEVKGWCVDRIDLFLLIEEKHQTLYISANDIPNYFVGAPKILSARNWLLLQSKKNNVDFRDSLSHLLLAVFVESVIKTASFKKGKVHYLVGAKEYVVTTPTNKEEKIRDYEDLTASKALLDGYTIKEIKGSHFEVTSASGKVQATSLNKCTCKEFADFNDCLHNKFARAVARNRPHLGYLLG